MSALSELALDLCFIREAGQPEAVEFRQAVQQELHALFAAYGSWSLTVKEEDGIEIAVAEMKGIGPWATEDEVLEYIDSKAGERFSAWLQGYRLLVEPKEDAGCCKCKH